MLRVADCSRLCAPSAAGTGLVVGCRLACSCSLLRAAAYCHSMLLNRHRLDCMKLCRLAEEPALPSCLMCLICTGRAPLLWVLSNCLGASGRVLAILKHVVCSATTAPSEGQDSLLHYASWGACPEARQACFLCCHCCFGVYFGACMEWLLCCCSRALTFA